MPTTIPAAVAAALRAAGSAALTGPARAECVRRVTAYGFDDSRRNIGGVRNGEHGGGGELATFPDIQTAAARLVALCRISGGAHPTDAAQGFDEGTGAFISIAPERGEAPLEITHDSGTGEIEDPDRAATKAQLARAIGGDDADADALIAYWRNLPTDQRAPARREMHQRLTEAGAADPEAATRETCRVLGDLAGMPDSDGDGIPDEGTGAAVLRPRKPTTKRAAPPRKPAAHQVVRARARMRIAAGLQSANAQIMAQRAAELADLRQQQADAQQQQPDQQQPDQQQPDQQQPDQGQPDQGQQADAPPPEGTPIEQPQTIAPPPAPAQLAERIAALEQELAAAKAKDEAAAADVTAAEADTTAFAGWFAQSPSEASAHAFADLTATHAALRAVPKIEEVPGYAGLAKDWAEFSAAWRAGDNAAPVCNGGAPGNPGIFDAPACESGLNSRIDAAEMFRRELTKRDPAWATKIKIPATLTEEQKNPNATRANESIVKPLLASAPALAALTDPAAVAKFYTGNAPKWHYGIAALAAVVTIGGGVYVAKKVL